MPTAKAKPTVSENPRAVEFPQDKYGTTRDLRKAGLRAAGAVRGDREKLEVLVATLDVLRAHAIARFSKDKEIRASRSEHSKNAVKREIEAAETMRKQSIRALEDQLTTLKTPEELKKEAK